MTLPATSPLLPQERRYVTVLFAKIHGFTRVTEALDAEALGDFLNGIWRRLDAKVQEHGGRVESHPGDSLKAIWGAPSITREDAERAVNCGLALHQAIARINAELAPLPFPPLQLRVCINSGLAATTVVDTTGEYTIVGEAVNLAARLLQAAAPGAVVIGAGAYRSVGDAFRLEALGPLEVSGVDHPVDAYRVEGREPYPARVRYHSAGGLEMRFTGRNREIARLRETFSRTFVTRRPHLVVITSESGIGKSRLIYEYTRSLELSPRRVLILSARALAGSKAHPFFLWEALWANRFDLVKDGEPSTEQCAKFATGITEIWGSGLSDLTLTEAIHILGHLAGLDWPDNPYLPSLRADPAALLKRAAVLAAELFRRAAQVGPTVIALDDLQFADDASLELIEALLDQPELPLLFIGGSRQAPASLRAEWADHERLTEMQLAPLPTTPETLTAIFPEADGLPPDFRRRLAELAAGNPYFLEELVKTLLHAGQIKPTDDKRWALAGDQAPEAIALPDTLRALLQARLDALSPSARGLALAAAVVGRVFWRGAVEALLRYRKVTSLLTPPEDDDWSSLLDRALTELHDQELVFERVGSTLATEREYIFKHELLRETAYRLLPRKYRQPYHALVAEWLAGRGAPDYALAAADQYAQAGQLDAAANQYREAAKHLKSRGYLREATKAEQLAEKLSKQCC